MQTTVKNHIYTYANTISKLSIYKNQIALIYEGEYCNEGISETIFKISFRGI